MLNRCRPQSLKAYEVYSFMEDNPILEIDMGERPPFSYKRRPLPLNLEEKKRGNQGLPHQRVGGLNVP